MPQADGPQWDLVFLSIHCVCSCVVWNLTWQPLQLQAPHLAAPTICSSGSSPMLSLGISLDLVMAPGGRRQGTQLDGPDVLSLVLCLSVTLAFLPYLFHYCVWNTAIIGVGGHPWVLKSIPSSVAVQLLSHVWLFCSPKDYSPTGSCVHGIAQARILKWVPSPILQGIFLDQGLNLHLLHWRWTLYHWATREAHPTFKDLNEHAHILGGIALQPGHSDLIGEASTEWGK